MTPSTGGQSPRKRCPAQKLTEAAPRGRRGYLLMDLPAGAALQTGEPSATVGYTRVAVQDVYWAPGKTVDLHLFATVNADAGRCSIDGLAVPA